MDTALIHYEPQGDNYRLFGPVGIDAFGEPMILYIGTIIKVSHGWRPQADPFGAAIYTTQGEAAEELLRRAQLEYGL